EDQVAELAEARVRADGRRLTAIEIDRPAAERNRRRRSALSPNDPGRSRAGTLAGESLFEDDDPSGLMPLGKIGGPPVDRPGPYPSSPCASAQIAATPRRSRRR